MSLRWQFGCRQQNMQKFRALFKLIVHLYLIDSLLAIPPVWCTRFWGGSGFFISRIASRFSSQRAELSHNNSSCVTSQMAPHPWDQREYRDRKAERFAYQLLESRLRPPLGNLEWHAWVFFFLHAHRRSKSWPMRSHIPQVSSTSMQPQCNARRRVARMMFRKSKIFISEISFDDPESLQAFPHRTRGKSSTFWLR